MLTDHDFVAAILLAIIITIIVLCVWPGLARIKARTLAGYWVAPAGTLYEIRETAGRTFTVNTAGRASSVPGEAVGVRGVIIPLLDKKGNVELGGRRIDWADGETWLRQGVERP